MNKKRFEHIDFLRAFSIIGVLAVHTLFYSLNNPINIFIWNVLEFVVVGFVFCSGFVSAAFYSESFTTWSSTLAWYKKRFLRLLAPFWVYLLLHYSFWFLFPGIFQGLGIEKSWDFFLKSFFLIGGIGINWLPLLFLEVTLLFPLLLKLLESRKALWGYVAFGICITAWFTIQPFPNNYYKLVMWIPWSLVFLLSIMLYRRERVVVYIKWILGAAIVFIPAFLYMKNTGRHLNMIEHKYPPDLYYLSYSVAATFLILLLDKIPIWRNNLLKSMVKFISANSYQLFFIEYIVLDVVLSLGKRGLYVNAGEGFLLVFILSVCITWVLTKRPKFKI